MSATETLGPWKTNEIHTSEALLGLQKLPDSCIDCVMTSPPYWGTRDYDLPPQRWPDGARSTLGLELDFREYIEHLCAIFDEVYRVLKPTGTVWVNLGDTYAGSYGKTLQSWSREATERSLTRPGSDPTLNHDPRTILSPASHRQVVRKRSLCQIPARFAIAMTERGWILRNNIVWYKPNHMPSSGKNRLTSSWEHVFLFVKQPRYFFDLDAIRVPHKTVAAKRSNQTKEARTRPSPHIVGHRLCPNPGKPGSFHPSGKNPGDTWQIHTRPSNTGHFATYPEKLCEQPIQAGCPIRACRRCGTPTLTQRHTHAQSQSSPGGDEHVRLLRSL